MRIVLACTLKLIKWLLGAAIGDTYISIVVIKSS